MEISLENLYLIVREYWGFSTVRTPGSCRHGRTPKIYARKQNGSNVCLPSEHRALLSESLKQANVKVERGST